VRYPAKRRFRLSEALKDRSGATAILVALSMPVVAGGMGLGAEAGYHYLLQRNLQQAADMAAHAGAIRLRSGDGEAGVVSAAKNAAVASGFTGPAEGIQPRTPPMSGAYMGSPSSVEVVLTMTQPRLFSRMFVDEPVAISARAVANVQQSGAQACVLALAPTASRAVTFSGSTSVSMENCDVAANSNARDAFFMQSAGAKLTVECVRTVGGAVTGPGLNMRSCDTVEELAPVVRDPYADVSEPAVEGTCINPGRKNDSSFAPNFTHSTGVQALRICGGLDVKKHATFAPGLYIIDGGELNLNANGSVQMDDVSVFGDGVTFYLARNTVLRFNGNGRLDLRAPTSGPYAGILFFGSRSHSGLTHNVLGNSGSTTQGAVYMPTSAIKFTGNSTTTNGCTQVIGRTVEFTGNSELRSNCKANNAREIEMRVLVSLVE
jgi:hypothetical protein